MRVTYNTHILWLRVSYSFNEYMQHFSNTCIDVLFTHSDSHPLTLNPLVTPWGGHIKVHTWLTGNLFTCKFHDSDGKLPYIERAFTASNNFRWLYDYSVGWVKVNTYWINNIVIYPLHLYNIWKVPISFMNVDVNAIYKLDLTIVITPIWYTFVETFLPRKTIGSILKYKCPKITSLYI